MFFPGETIVHKFVIPFTASEIDKVTLSYKQNEAIMFEKTIISGFEDEGHNITSIEVPFTQEEGLLFADDTDFTIQVNVYTIGGTRHASHLVKSSSGVQYLREIMTHERIHIVTQPENCYIDEIGETAVFAVEASGAMRYQWQYTSNDITWIDISNETRDTLSVVSTADIIARNKYHCIATDIYGNNVTSDVVRIILRERSGI